jgi:hypothetical protein
LAHEPCPGSIYS